MNTHPSLAPLAPRPTLTEIRKVFPSAMGTGIILPKVNSGLGVQFHKRADLCEELKLASPTAKISHSGLFDLVQKFNFVVLRNCSALTMPDKELSQLSKGKDFDLNFIQDPYHYDVPPPQNDLNLPQNDYMSGIYKKSAEERKIDTFCAPEIEVKKAIPQLDVKGLPLEVVEALDHMASPDYHFRLYNPIENDARQVVKVQYPQFVQDVFDKIPADRKYRQKWLKDQWDILLISNVYGDWLHARPTGPIIEYNEPAQNLLRGLYLFSE